jgi:hypothetical protein
VDPTDWAHDFFQSEMKATCSRVFDVSIQSVGKQAPDSVASIFGIMAMEWEYVGMEWDMKKF